MGGWGSGLGVGWGTGVAGSKRNWSGDGVTQHAGMWWFTGGDACVAVLRTMMLGGRVCVSRLGMTHKGLQHLPENLLSSRGSLASSQARF